MQYILTPPADLQADIVLPASKSISNRALILHALSGGSTRPSNLSDCDDTRVLIQALDHPAETIDIGAAGTAMRFLTAYLSVTPGTHVLTGTPRMQQRPIGILVDALRSLGAQITYTANEGFPPLHITGNRLDGQEVTLAGNVSSQYISALLMIGSVLPQGLTLHLTGDIISRPYINLTLQLIKDFGAQATWTSAHSITVYAGDYRDTAFTVESDWSAASYWYEILALFLARNPGKRQQASIRLAGLFERSYQGDSRGADLFAALGVMTNFTPQGVVLSAGCTTVSRLDADLVDMPDLAQTFVVTCCFMGIPFRFTGLQSLKIKETDRIAALKNELGKLGYPIADRNDSVLEWDGRRTAPQSDPAIDTYDDHRMALAFAPAAVRFPGLVVNHPEVVSKSYPDFWDDLKQNGFTVNEI